MTTERATALGFTEAVTAENVAFVLTLLVQPGTDLDGRFKAWDCDEQEFVMVSGWSFDIYPTSELAA